MLRIFSEKISNEKSRNFRDWDFLLSGFFGIGVFEDHFFHFRTYFFIFGHYFSLSEFLSQTFLRSHGIEIFSNNGKSNKSRDRNFKQWTSAPFR